MQTKIEYLEVTAYEVPYSDYFYFEEAKVIESVGRDTIKEWKPENPTEVILTLCCQVGVNGRDKSGEAPYFYATIVTQNIVKLFEDKKRL